MKLGLGESYDKVDVLPVKIRAWLDLTKPASSVGVAGAYFLGSLFYFYYTNQSALIAEQFTTIIYVVVTVGLAHGASQAMNMAEDADMDRETPHKQDRPIPAGIVSEEEARSLAWILIGIALGRAYITNNTFGILMSVLIFFGVFYNLKPIRAKERIISIPWQAVSRGLFAFPAVWAAYGDIWSPTPWILGLFMFFYVLGFQNSADIIDRKVDAKHGIRTFVVEFGVRKTVLIAFGCTMAMISVMAFAIWLSLIPVELSVMLLIIPFCLYMVVRMWNEPYAVSERTGNHPMWLWFYGGMILSVALPLGISVLLK